MNEADIAGKLGQLLAGQDNTNRDIGRFRDEAARAAATASESRRVLYKTIEELKDKLVADVNDVRTNQKLLNQRLEVATNQISMMTPSVLDIPSIRIAVDDLSEAHDDIKKTVATLKEAKDNLEGVTRGAMTATRMWWVVLVAIGSTIGSAMFTFWHWLQAGSGSPPGR